MSRFSVLIALMPGVMLGACNTPTSTGCTREAVASIVIFASDTLLPRLDIDPRHAVATIDDGAVVDTLTFGGASIAPDFLAALYYLLDERPGTYTVTLDLPPYRTWKQTNVRVMRSGCHVVTAQLYASLQR